MGSDVRGGDRPARGELARMSEAELELSRPPMRTEHDSMGEVLVPVAAHYGAQTHRAVENFPISGIPIDRRLIRALALIKGAAAGVNASLRDVAVDRRQAVAIAAAAEQVAEGI